MPKNARARRRHLRPAVEAHLALHGWQVVIWGSHGQPHIINDDFSVCWDGAVVVSHRGGRIGARDGQWGDIPSFQFWRIVAYLKTAGGLP